MRSGGRRNAELDVPRARGSPGCATGKPANGEAGGRPARARLGVVTCPSRSETRRAPSPSRGELFCGMPHRGDDGTAGDAQLVPIATVLRRAPEHIMAAPPLFGDMSLLSLVKGLLHEPERPAVDGRFDCATASGTRLAPDQSNGVPGPGEAAGVPRLG
eukprot:scaffold8624_cov110-Isochrysis_galbana.AAC.8